MNKPTQGQVYRMILLRTFRTSVSVGEATDELGWWLENVTDLDLLAEGLRFHGFILNPDAINLAKGKGWTMEEMSDADFARYITPNRFSKKEQ
jgi:hypothetical protein